MFNLYKNYISPALHVFISPLSGSTSACRFHPTCSEYAKEAINQYGIIQGSLMGCYRFLRCNPFSKGGHDPVPTK